MRYEDFDDRESFIPLEDEEGKVITMDEYEHLLQYLRDIKSDSLETVRRLCWAELKRLRAGEVARRRDPWLPLDYKHPD